MVVLDKNNIRKEYFNICVKQYDRKKNHFVKRPASVNNPQNNAVMFITKEFIQKVSSFMDVKECLIFWPENVDVPNEIKKKHAVILCNNPHLEYCKFFCDNNIDNLPQNCKGEIRAGAYISEGAVIGDNCVIMPGAYVGPQIEIGKNVYIGTGTKLVGEAQIGDNVVIRENVVIGADGMTTDRDENGKIVSMPQFGNIIIENNVRIGSGTVIERGAIDCTIIKSGCRLDCNTLIAHNVYIGQDSIIVCEAMTLGSVTIGEQCLISGNAIIGIGKNIGDGAIVGMGSVVTKDVIPNTIVKGNPAK